MATTEHRTGDETFTACEKEPISETYVEVEMEDAGGYSIQAESLEERKIPPTTTAEVNPTEHLDSQISSTSPQNSWEATDPMPGRESQPREINYPELRRPPTVPKHGERSEDARIYSQRLTQNPAEEEKGKGRAPPTTFPKPAFRVGEGKITISQLQQQLSQEKKTSAQLEEHLVKKTTEVSKLEDLLYHNNNFLTEAEAKFQAANFQCKTLRMKLEDTTEDLRQTQEHIFRLQPKEQGITQSDALVAYTAICDSVQSWIGYQLDGALDDGRVDLGKLNKGSTNKIIKLLTPMGLKGTKFAETDEWNLIAAVMEFLRSQILEREFYGALEMRDLDLMRRILRNMENLRPPRDLESRRSWRSETLEAMVHSAEFDRGRKKRIEELSEELLQILGVIDVAILNEKCFDSLQRNIIEPTVNLAHQLHVSKDRFRVQWSEDLHATPSEKSQGPSILEKYDCCNVLTNGKSVRLDGKERVGGEGVTYLFDIVPGFYCQTFKEDLASNLKVLKKPKVLVAVGKPGRKDVVPLAGKGGTILASLYDMLHSGKK